MRVLCLVIFLIHLLSNMIHAIFCEKNVNFYKSLKMSLLCVLY